jgi:hypothetical protein
VDADTTAAVLKEWERQRGDDFRAHFQRAHSYLARTVEELASDDAAWTVTPHEGRSVLVLAGDTAFALLAFSGEPDSVTMSGALHALDEGVIRVSFSDQRAKEDIDLDGGRRVTPMVRKWAFDWHGRLQLPIEYWLSPLSPIPADSPLLITMRGHERQRAVAHKLARAAGWPLPAQAGGEREVAG